MTYSEGLGANIAAVRPDLRAFQYAVQQRAASPSPWPTVNRTTTFVPRTTTTAVPRPTTVTRTVTPTTPVIRKAPVSTFRPVIPAPTPVKGQPTGSAGIMPVLKLPPVAEENEGMTQAFSFTSSPLLLAAFGVAALLLFNRR